MSIASVAVPWFRTKWADRLVDTCTINRQAEGVLNTTTGVIAAGADGEQYSGDCLVRPVTRLDKDYGQEKITVNRYIVFVPYDTDGIEPDDQVVLDAVAYDSNLQGEILRVVSIEGDSYNTVRRLYCAHNLGGGSSA